MPPCCICKWPSNSLTSVSFQRVLNLAFYVISLFARVYFLILSTYLSNDFDKTRPLVKVVSNVSTKSGLLRKASVSPRSSDWICDSEAVVSLSCEHKVSTVMGARFHALRIFHSVCAAPTQLPVIRSYGLVSTETLPTW